MITNPEILDKEYRADLNGLRAVAVLLVLLFHLEYDFLPAGFLGVDVFLVLSGYLIGRKIVRELELNSFSFRGFYKNRLKRLFPALFFTFFLTLLVGCILLSPPNLERLGKSALSGMFSIANIFFFREQGYFELQSEFKPLLHIWPLSLEEQFYFIWPLLLFVLFKNFRQKLYLLVFIIIVISLYLSSIFINTSENAVFYLLPFRLFEFLLGFMVVWLDKYTLKNKIYLEFILLLGLATIILSSILFSKLSPMPGILSLLPCIGTMMVIYAGKAKYSSWLLKNKLFEIIGKSSYSIYLIHWPLIVYYKYGTLSELTSLSKIIIGILSLVFGFLMWRYIENIFRKSSIRYFRINSVKIDRIWLWITSTVIILTLFGAFIWINKGLPSRYPTEFTMTSEEILKNRARYWKDSNAKSTILEGSNDKNLIIMGNSHANDLIYALKNNGLEANITSLRTSHLCYNFGASSSKKFYERCSQLLSENLNSSDWSEADAIYLHDHWPRKNFPDLRRLLNRIRALTDAPIYVFGPKMVFKKPIPDIIHSCKSSFPSAINKFAQDFANLENRTKMNNSLLELFSDKSFKEKKIFYIDVLDLSKNDKGRFEVISSKTFDFLYFDKGHFTLQGSKEFGEKLKVLKPHLFDLSDSEI